MKLKNLKRILFYLTILSVIIYFIFAIFHDFSSGESLMTIILLPLSLIGLIITTFIASLYAPLNIVMFGGSILSIIIVVALFIWLFRRELRPYFKKIFYASSLIIWFLFLVYFWYVGYLFARSGFYLN